MSNDGERFEKFYLNSSLERENIGELIILIGENNVGKWNILDALSVIKRLESGEKIPLALSDAPDFMDYEDCKPEIRLVYDDVDGKSYDVRYFLDYEGTAQVETNLELDSVYTRLR